MAKAKSRTPSNKSVKKLGKKKNGKDEDPKSFFGFKDTDKMENTFKTIGKINNPPVKKKKKKKQNPKAWTKRP